MNNRILVITLLFCVVCANADGQVLFKTSDDESGIIKPYGTGYNLGFDFGKEEAIFSYSLAKDSTIIDGSKTISRFLSSNFKFSLPIEENQQTLADDGALVPAFGISYERVWNKDQLTNDTRYGFIKFSYDMNESKFGRVDPATDSIFVDSEVSTSFLFMPGWNWLKSTCDNLDNVIIGLSFPIRYKINPTDDLKKKEYITDYDPARNGVVQESEEAYSSRLDDFLSITTKLDLACTPWVKKNETGARFGFITSFAARYNIMDNKMRGSFSIGPSMHPKFSTSTVIASIQAEFIDFNNSTGDKGIKDIFAVKFYVGLPLQKAD